jgi:hypothetical protein
MLGSGSSRVPGSDGGADVDVGNERSVDGDGDKDGDDACELGGTKPPTAIVRARPRERYESQTVYYIQSMYSLESILSSANQTPIKKKKSERDEDTRELNKCALVAYTSARVPRRSQGLVVVEGLLSRSRCDKSKTAASPDRP